MPDDRTLTPATPATASAVEGRQPREEARAGAGWLRTALVANLILQMLIIVTGGLVRLTGSGLGCPTWPQCTPGSFTPVANQAQGYHVYVEFGNRLMTFVLAAVAIALVYAARRWGAHRRHFVVLATVPLLGILAQAVVGGISVLARLDPKSVSPHFLLSVVLVAYSAWLLARYDDGDSPREPAVPPALRGLAHAASGVFAVVVVLGTAVTGSGPHSGDADEPVRFGFDPLVSSRLHAGSVWLFVALVAAVVVLGSRAGTPRRYRVWWRAVLALALLEGAVGYTQFLNGLPVALVAFHMLVSAVLTAAVAFGVLACKRPSRAAPA